MKIVVTLLLSGMGLLGRAQGALDVDTSTVTVCLPDGADDPDVNLHWAKKIASRMFDRVGVHIRWQAGQLESCRPWLAPIVLSLTSDTPKKFAPDILAYAHPSEGVHITVFTDRVVLSAQGETRLATALLAHVMVHEITHILEGVNRHSSGGIMKARWTDDDIKGMIVKPLLFAPEDIHLIQAGLAARPALFRRRPDTNPFLRLTKDERQVSN